MAKPVSWPKKSLLWEAGMRGAISPVQPPGSFGFDENPLGLAGSVAFVSLALANMFYTNTVDRSVGFLFVLVWS